MYPFLQMQLWEPLVFVQLALSLLDNKAIISDEQLFCFFQSLTNFTSAWLSFSSVSFLTGAAMGAISVCTIRIYVTIMASIAAFVDI